MSKVHMSLKGEWVPCRAQLRECPRSYHLPNMTPAEAKKLPTSFLEQLFGPLGGAPAVLGQDGSRYWGLPLGSATTVEDPLADFVGPIVEPSGDMVYLMPHRDYDQPAVELASGRQEWWSHGRRHREQDRPAVTVPDGSQAWYRRGLLHRELPHPARIMPDGTRSWYLQGVSQPEPI